MVSHVGMCDVLHCVAYPKCFFYTVVVVLLMLVLLLLLLWLTLTIKIIITQCQRETQMCEEGECHPV